MPTGEPMRLLLSGGGFRAATASFGAVAYLIHSERWEDVTEVVSVSGGSIANAALAAAPDDPPWERLGGAIERLDNDLGRPWATPRRMCISLSGVAGVAGAAILLAVAAGLGPDLPALASVLVGVMVIPVLFRLLGTTAGAMAKDLIEVVSGGRGHRLMADEQQSRAFLFCCSGLSSATPYVFWTGRPMGAGREPRWGAELQSPYTVVEAALASVSLPFLGRVMSPKEPTDPESLPGGEVLVDGGVSGIFGDQAATPFRRTPRDTVRSDDLQTLALDAGRHVTSPGRLTRSLLRWSATGTLYQWLKASLEATYVNDLVDLAPKSLVRICEADEPLTDPDDDLWTMSPALTLRLTPTSAPKPDAVVTATLACVRERVQRTNLTNLNSIRINEALIAGFVGTMITLEPDSTEQDVVTALSASETRLRLGHRLTEEWADLVRAARAEQPTGRVRPL